MLRNILTKTIYDRRTGMIWWSIGLVVMVVFMVGFYPMMKDNDPLQQAMEGMGEGMKEMMAAFTGSSDIAAMFTPAGFTHSRLFAMMLPLLLLIFGIGMGTRIIAGEETQHTMDILLANPVRRSQIVLQGFGALIALIVALGLVNWLAVWVLTAMLDMNLSGFDLLLATLNSVLLALFFGAMALLVGAATGNRGMSLGIPTAVAFATYLFNTLAEPIPDMKPLRLISPFYYTVGRNVLLNGINWAHAGLILALTAVMVALSVVLFQRRDVAV